MASYGRIKILSNDGSETLVSQQVDAWEPVISVTSTGLKQGTAINYVYSGNKKFLGVSTTPNATEPTYAVGGEYTLPRIESATTFSLYIVEGEANTPTLTYDLSQLDLSEGTHSITVVAKADGYSNSAPSNAVEYVVEASLPVWNGTDLTGTSWYVPSGWYASSGYGDYIIEGTCRDVNLNVTYPFNDNGYINFSIGYNSSTKKTNCIRCECLNNGVALRKVFNNAEAMEYTFVGGSGVTQSTLISWLKQYGTLTSHTIA